MTEAPSICILTAGKGTRMGAYCEHLNKALLPLGKKAIISHIIERFPSSSEFVIAVGHRAEQVQTYVEMAHPTLVVKFVTVDIFEGPGSGPGYSTLCCRPHLQKPFFYVSCDTLWDLGQTLPTDHDWFATDRIIGAASRAYCNFKVDSNSTIIDIFDKEEVSGPQFVSFAGMGFVKSFELFWGGLDSPSLIQGEVQISNAISPLVSEGLAKSFPINWTDTGDKRKYEVAVSQFEKYDFSKMDEALFFSQGRVIKYFADESFSAKRVKKASLNPTVFPEISSAKNGFYSYPFIDGKTLYDYCTPEIFAKLLPFLIEKLWIPAAVDHKIFHQACDVFYRVKTIDRIEKYRKKYPLEESPAFVNDTSMRPIDTLLSAIPWKNICEGTAAFFHGDFHFDHIIYEPQSETFKLLDWRQDFGGHVEFGDIYYDLTKFCGGLVLNYDYIRMGLFQYSQSGNRVWIDYASRSQGNYYRDRFESFMTENSFSVEKVRLMIPIIYFNMAPLHHYPFDKFLYAKALLMLQEELSAQGLL